jgi:hypothetical protein
MLALGGGRPYGLLMRVGRAVRAVVPGGLALAALLLVGCSGGEESAASAPAATLQVGECLRLVDGTGEESGSLDEVPCDQPHAGEVILASERFFAEDEELPPLDRLQSLADAACEDAVRTYSGMSSTEAGVRMSYLSPSKDTWSQGDRSLTCLAVSFDASTGEIVEVTGTLAAS